MANGNILPEEEIVYYHNPVLMDLFIAESNSILNTDIFAKMTRSKIFEQGILCGFIPNKLYKDEEGNFILNGLIYPSEENVRIDPNWFIEYPIGYAEYYDVFYLLPMDLFTGEIVYSNLYFEKSAPYHLAICPPKDKEESYSLFMSFQSNYLVYSKKNIIKIYIPRISDSYWGIYLIVKQYDITQQTTQYLPIIVVRRISQEYYDNKDENKFKLNPEDENSYWFLEPEIVRIGLIKQKYNYLTGNFEYNLILDERDEIIYPGIFAVDLAVNDFKNFIETLNYRLISSSSEQDE